MGKKAIDVETGEIGEEPEFVKLYIHDVCRLKNISGGKYEVFLFMLKNMNRSNEVCFGGIAKKKFLQDHSMENQTFNNYASFLVKTNLVERIGRGEFRVNKKYAAKVDWNSVQSIKWTATYTRDGLKEEVHFVPENCNKPTKDQS